MKLSLQVYLTALILIPGTLEKLQQANITENKETGKSTSTTFAEMTRKLKHQRNSLYLISMIIAIGTGCALFTRKEKIFKGSLTLAGIGLGLTTLTIKKLFNTIQQIPDTYPECSRVSISFTLD